MTIQAEGADASADAMLVDLGLAVAPIVAEGLNKLPAALALAITNLVNDGKAKFVLAVQLSPLVVKVLLEQADGKGAFIRLFELHSGYESPTIN